MSENKRVPLIALGAPKESDKPPKEPRKTLRIRVVLPESTEDTCPEFNYKDELAAAKKRSKHKGPSDVQPNGFKGLENLDDDDEDAKRFARLMEEKYGTGTSLSKKKRKGRKDDYADIGMGYDESDSFIDNTDGYDEMIPQNVTTLHGGFYINSGALEFKTDDEANSDFSSSSSDDDVPKKASSRKKIIESSDETDRENKTESVASENPKKRKLQNGGNGLQPALKKKLLGQNKIYIKKRRPLDPLKRTVKDLLREKREDLNMSIPGDLKPEDAEVVEDDKKTSNVSDIIESVVKASTEDAKSEVKEDNKAATIEIAVASTSSNKESSHDATTNEVKLPENLSPEIVTVIASIKNSATFNADGKVNFSSDLDGLILKLERKGKCLGKPSKMKVYEHLATFLKCKPDKLIRRAKNLVLEDEQKKLQNLLTGLQHEINKIMPSLLENHEKESQRILQKKFSQESAENEENKSLRMPKRRFQWSDVTKKYVKDILMLKKRCLLLEGKTKEELDNPMLVFLKSNIQVLWPEGWMSMNALNKIYTTYADPKRVLNSGSAPSSSATSSISQGFNNSNVSITPIVNSDISKETSVNLSKKSLPEPCDIKPVSPKKDSEVGKLKVKPQSELLKNPVNNDNSVIIIDNPKIKNDLKQSDNNYCQVIDLSDKNDLKSKPDSRRDYEIVKDTTITPVIPDQRAHIPTSKHHELSITPTFPPSSLENVNTKTSDDIQKVMEDLKVLQKMSSPKKCVETSQSSSAVSVIAVNKNFAPKQVHTPPSSMQRFDYHKPDYTTSFQDEFQKQLFSALNHMPPQKSSKSYNRCQLPPTSGTGMAAVDKYYQNSNNNYAQSSNGHKNSTSSNQSGTYSILDDMFANLLTQYGYSKEATTPKTQQK